MAFPGRPAPFAAVSGAAWETWDLEQVADTGGGARKPGGGRKGRERGGKGAKPAHWVAVGGNQRSIPSGGPLRTCVGSSSGKGRLGHLSNGSCSPPSLCQAEGCFWALTPYLPSYASTWLSNPHGAGEGPTTERDRGPRDGSWQHAQEGRPPRCR